MANILYFSTPWCGPCRSFKPIVQEVAGQTGVPVQYIDAEQQRPLALQYGVTSVPSIVVIDGHNVIKFTGPQPKSKLTEIFTTAKKSL